MIFDYYPITTSSTIISAKPMAKPMQCKKNGINNAIRIVFITKVSG
ncbi:MAG: hypothetical protein IK117_11315 [Bacteroidales bacterium]|nr:hypothetical protein [Bacteroidales bacterium]